MNIALENSIYYTDRDPGYTEITNLEYDGSDNNNEKRKTNFIKLIKSIRSNVDVKNFFKNYDNICYDILEGIGRNYDKLLIGQLDKLLIVTRKDLSIYISRNDKMGSIKKGIKKEKIGIIRIDSVVSEILAEKKINGGHGLIFIFCSMVLIGFMWCKNISS